jgi:hypothetical protein
VREVRRDSFVRAGEVYCVPAGEEGGVPPLVELVRSASSPSSSSSDGGLAAEHAVRCLLNLSLDTANQDAVREAEGIPPLVTLLGHGSRATLFAAWCLAEMRHGNAANDKAIQQAHGYAPLVQLLAMPPAHGHKLGHTRSQNVLTTMHDAGTHAAAHGTPPTHHWAATPRSPALSSRARAPSPGARAGAHSPWGGHSARSARWPYAPPEMMDAMYTPRYSGTPLGPARPWASEALSGAASPNASEFDRGVSLAFGA